MRLRGQGRCSGLFGPDLGRCLVAMSFDDPGLIVGLLEFEQGATQVFDGLEGADPQQVFLERADEAFGTAVALRGAHEGRRALDAEEGDLGLEVVGHVLAAVVMAQGEPRGDTGGEGPEPFPHALADRLQGLEAGRPFRRVDADAFRRAVIHGDEHADLAVGQGDGGRQVGAPHLVDPFAGDRSVVGSGASGPASPMWRQQAVLAHQPQDAPFRGPQAGEAQPGPDLAIAFAVKRAGFQDAADFRNQLRVGHWPLGTSTAPIGPGRRMAGAIDRGPGHAPGPAHGGDPVGSVRGGRDVPAHGLDLRRAKGRPASRRAILPSSSSLSRVSSPTFERRRRTSSSRSSAGRVLSAAWPAARKSSRQPEIRAAGTPRSRETRSRSSPRRIRRTAPCLRLADIRPFGASSPGPSPVALRAPSEGPGLAISSVISILLLQMPQSAIGCLKKL